MRRCAHLGPRVPRKTCLARRTEGTDPAPTHDYPAMCSVALAFCVVGSAAPSFCTACVALPSLDCGDKAVLPGRCVDDHAAARGAAAGISAGAHCLYGGQLVEGDCRASTSSD